MTRPAEWVALDTRALRRKLAEDRAYQAAERTLTKAMDLLLSMHRGWTGTSYPTIDAEHEYLAQVKEQNRVAFNASDQQRHRLDELLALCQACWVRPRHRDRVWMGETIPVCRDCLLANDGT